MIWTSLKSVDHKTNDRVMVHGDVTRADGHRAGSGAKYSQIVGSRDRRPAPSIFGSRSNVVHAQASYLARPTTKAPETQTYFTTHGSGALPALRLRTVVRGERASRSIVNRRTALWSIWVVSSLILAGPGLWIIFYINVGRGFVVSRGSNGAPNLDEYVFNRPRWTLPLTNERKRT